MADSATACGRLPGLMLGIVLSLCAATPAPAAGQSAQQPTALDVHQALSFVDHRGRPITGLPGKGMYRLIYFGYTSCPDVCPIDVQKLSAVMHALGADAARVQPLFITVDPKRDTPKVLAGYVQFFHPRLIGLTGTWPQVAAAKRVFAVRAMKFYPLPVEDGGPERTEEQDNAHYTFNHTTFTYLVSPDGDIVERFERAMNIGVMADRIRMRLHG